MCIDATIRLRCGCYLSPHGRLITVFPPPDCVLPLLQLKSITVLGAERPTKLWINGKESSINDVEYHETSKVSGQALNPGPSGSARIARIELLERNALVQYIQESAVPQLSFTLRLLRRILNRERGSKAAFRFQRLILQNLPIKLLDTSTSIVFV